MKKLKELPVKKVNNKTYLRFGIKTHFIQIKEPLLPIIKKYALPLYKKGDFIAIAEKAVAISQGRVVHESAVKPSLLAKLIVTGVKKYEDDVGYSDARKMQVAIHQAGWLRMVLALFLGSITRLFGRHGDFYRIAGNHISEIDGFNPKAMPPFNEFAMLGPDKPDELAQEIEDNFGIPTVIIDGNNINVEVLGASKNIPVSRGDARLVLFDNPMGQNDEMTPIILVRLIKVSS